MNTFENTQANKQSRNLIQKILHKIWWTFFRQEGTRKVDKDIKVYIISYPKSGRTWLRLLIGKTLCENFNLDEKLLLDTLKLTKAAKILPSIWTHDGAGIGSGPHFVRFITDKSIFQDKKVIFLCRNPKDVMVSYFFHATKRIPEFTNYTGSISEFIRSQGYGIKKLIAFYQLWYKNKNIPEDFLLIRYEDMHKDPHKVLKKVLEFMGAKDIREEVIENAVNFGRFDNLKKMEIKKEFSKTIIQPGDVKDDESYKMRKGKIGGYVDYLSQEDIDYIDKVIAEMGCPFYGLGNDI